MRSKTRSKAWLCVLPLYLFTLFFVAVPLVYVFVLSFLSRDVSWGVTSELTLDNYRRILSGTYLGVFGQSLLVAFLTTLLTSLIGYPFGYLMARLPKKRQSIVMALVIVPFWTNALVRIYGWIILLRTQGIVNSILQTLGAISEPLKILYTTPAVLIGMVYALLPFMIFAVYSSAEKMNWQLVDAARDLGAGRIRAFLTITFRHTLPGLLSGFVLVFVPSVGLFFISDLLGGGKIVLVGNLIQNQLLTSRDWPFGAALSVAMMAVTLLIIWLYRKLTHVKDLEGLL